MLAIIKETLLKMKLIEQCCSGGDPNWVEIANFCTVLIGGAFALWQWWRSCRVSRAEHLNEILEKYDVKTMTDLFIVLSTILHMVAGIPRCSTLAAYDSIIN